jgi:ribosomal protein S18 acetylase RimI-like enzyme
MTPHEIIQRIDAGTNNYIRLFGEAAHMESIDKGAYRIIRPKKGEQGVKFVCDIRPETLDRKLVRKIKRLKMPVWWPLQLPDHLKFKPDVDLCMAVLPGEIVSNGKAKFVQRVKNAEDFARWVTFVNDTMHGGYPYVHPRYHWPLCERGAMRCFYIEIDGQIVATAAIEPNGADASLEFVATGPAHRRQGLASGVCAAAVEDAFARGAEIVTLTAGNPGTRELYTPLGFKIYNGAI